MQPTTAQPVHAPPPAFYDARHNLPDTSSALVMQMYSDHVLTAPTTVVSDNELEYSDPPPALNVQPVGS